MDLFTSAGAVLDLRQYQTDATDAVIRYLKENEGSPIICAATGTGKSIIIASLCKRIAKANPAARIMCATHVAELLEQNSGKLLSILPGADVGIYSAGLGRKEIANQFIFAGIQSVYREKKLGKFNVLIIDEAHTISRKDVSMWAKLIGQLKEENPRLRVVGLSATPFRMDSGSLTSGDDSLFDEIVFDYSLGRAIQDGYLAPLVSKYTETQYNIDGVGKVAGEYNMGQLEKATNVDHLTRQAVTELVKKGADRKSWLIFCNGVAHSFSIRDEIRRHGITCETVTGETPDDERARILREFKAGKIRSVTNNAVWTTGIDVPGLDLIGMFRHTMSGGLLLQMAGRGTRTVIDANAYKTAKERRDAIAASDKPNCLFLDFAKNIERHGFLDQIKARGKGEKGEGVAPMKMCPDCFSILHAAAKTCKDCGHEFPIEKKEHIGSAYNGNVLSGNPEYYEVLDISYMAHNVNKEGKIPCLRVKYFCGRKSFSEYICIQHTGFAKQNAMKWWNERSEMDIDGCDVEYVMKHELYKTLKTPKAISVIKDKKFDRIIKHHDLSFGGPKSHAIEEVADEDDFSIRF